MSSSKLNITRKKTNMTQEVVSSLRRSYGEVLLPTGSTLYHTCEYPFVPNPTKPMLFTTLHPSEWLDNINNHVTIVRLRRSVSLLFMIGDINDLTIKPVLNRFIGIENGNLAKQYDANTLCFSRYLQQERFDGWISTIDGGSTIEIALLNSPDLFEVISCKPCKADWKKRSYRSGKLIPKSWGTSYPISTVELPATLRINRRYEPFINNYMQTCNETDPCSTSFYMLLQNATIVYHDATISVPKWECPIDPVSFFKRYE
jgi:hypothetical protein